MDNPSEKESFDLCNIYKQVGGDCQVTPIV
jgi:hypothetical protein